MQEIGLKKKEYYLHLKIFVITFVAKKLFYMHKNNNRDMVADYNYVSVLIPVFNQASFIRKDCPSGSPDNDKDCTQEQCGCTTTTTTTTTTSGNSFSGVQIVQCSCSN